VEKTKIGFWFRLPTPKVVRTLFAWLRSWRVPARILVFAFSTFKIHGRLGSNYPTTAPQYTKIPVDLMREAQKRNVPIYTKNRMADNISLGILDEIEDHHNIKFVLMGWPGPLDANTAPNNTVKVLLEKAKTNMAVLLSRNPGKIRNILVPIAGGPHSRLALRVAYEIATQENAL
jgi:hypothetical protein